MSRTSAWGEPVVNKSITTADIKGEVAVITARSGGAGGQHVNKVETKVILKWNVRKSEALDDAQRSLILNIHQNKLTRNDELVIASESTRSQLRNKEIAFKKLERILTQAFQKKKKRIQTKPTKSSKRQRLFDKKRNGEKKELRRKVG